MATVEAVFEELNFPSAPRLKRVLAARGIPFNANEVDRLVRGETTRQVQAPAISLMARLPLVISIQDGLQTSSIFLQPLPRARARTLG